MIRWVPALLATLALPAQAQLSTSFTFDASANQLTQNERDLIMLHLDEAGRYWYRALGVTAPRSIQLRVVIGSNPTANAGSATSVDVGMINGRTTYQQGVGAELRSGVDPNGTAVDGTVTIGLNYLRNSLWFDPYPLQRTAPIPADRTDAFSVMTHEWGHMIAYNGWADGAGIPPATYWSTWDRWMQPGTPTVIVGPYSVQTWGTPPDVTTNNVSHWGNAAVIAATPPDTPRAVVWDNGAPVPWIACEFPQAQPAPPSGPFAMAGNTLVDELMNGVVYYHQRRYYISALDIAVLADVGLLVDGIFANGFQP